MTTEELNANLTAWNDTVQTALNRMRRAHERGTGCHLTAEMISAFSVSFLGELWDEEAPTQDEEAGK